MQNGNTLVIESGGSLIIGSNIITKNLNSGNASILQISGTLEIWGNLNLTNSLSVTVTGTMILQGDFNGGNDATVNVDGLLEINGDVNVGNNSTLTGTGTVIVDGVCNGPASFCSSGPLADTIPPVISNCPADIVVSLSGAICDEVVNWVHQPRLIIAV